MDCQQFVVKVVGELSDVPYHLLRIAYRRVVDQLGTKTMIDDTLESLQRIEQTRNRLCLRSIDLSFLI